MPLWKQILLCLVVVLLAAGGWYFYQQRDSSGGALVGAGGQGGGGGGQPRFGPTFVVTDAVTSDVEKDQVRSVGTVKVPRSINLYPQVSAVVTEVLFKAGDKVAKDQPLVRLDDQDQRVALDLANVALKDAKSALDRAQKLADSRNLSVSALEDAQSGYRKAQIAVLGAQIALDRRTISAPFEGVVGLSNLSEGDFVTSSTVVTTVDDVSTMLVSFPVPERYSGRLAEGLAVKATPASQANTSIAGKVTSIDTRVDPAARTLKVEASLDAAAAAAAGVKPGMSVVVTLDFEGEKRLAISALSIQWDRNGSYIWTVKDDVAKRVPVNVLERQSGQVLVAGEGLSEGDRVVVEGLQRLRDGAKVTELGIDPGGNRAAAGADKSESGAGNAPATVAKGG
ncbi:MexH family multidrug efflux RND transporter periplasmic adaptor subunit [Kaistia sp. 32K]|uniref:efflux RND transporter periplasmic adaptor subunit n=1 Tax=Kaistia sp. 32K TaxID=2795690 RepID=UPI00191672C3|nr:efflux RND transporter periplasmic adaptor subunit [Kaistia sp. 32K]BCP52733.1 MexH family multidrug efflux RND transporter periplasmic adaptor subunit [Kaistia sp. 32K]